MKCFPNSTAHHFDYIFIYLILYYNIHICTYLCGLFNQCGSCGLVCYIIVCYMYVVNTFVVSSAFLDNPILWTTVFKDL